MTVEEETLVKDSSSAGMRLERESEVLLSVFVLVSGVPINDVVNGGLVGVGVVIGCENDHLEMDDVIKRVISSMA